MDRYEKSKAYLITGFIFSLPITALFGYLTYYLFRATQQTGEHMGIAVILLFFIPLFVFALCMLSGMLTICSIVSGIFSIICVSVQRRKLFRFCRIFSKISLNFFSAVGARMGLEVERELREEQKRIKQIDYENNH